MCVAVTINVCICICNDLALVVDPRWQESDGVPEESSEDCQSVHGPVLASTALHRDPEQIRVLLRERERCGNLLTSQPTICFSSAFV